MSFTSGTRSTRRRAIGPSPACRASRQPAHSALSQTTENRKVEARKPLIFYDQIFGFYLQNPTLQQSPRDPLADIGWAMEGYSACLLTPAQEAPHLDIHQRHL